MSQVQILKMNDLFAKISLKIKVLFYFKSFSFISSCINDIHIFCFPSKLAFRFPFHSVFHSIPFSVPFSISRLVTPLKTKGVETLKSFNEVIS